MIRNTAFFQTLRVSGLWEIVDFCIRSVREICWIVIRMTRGMLAMRNLRAAGVRQALTLVAR